MSGAVLCGSGYDYKAETEKIYSSGLISMHYPWTEAVWFHMYTREHKKMLATNPKINVKAVLRAKGIAEVEELLIVPVRSGPSFLTKLMTGHDNSAGPPDDNMGYFARPFVAGGRA